MATEYNYDDTAQQNEKLLGGGEKFQKTAYRDPLWAVLFLAQFGIMAYFGFTAIHTLNGQGGSTVTLDPKEQRMFNMAGTMMALAFSGGVAVAAMWVSFMKTCPAALIKMCLFLPFIGYAFLFLVNPILAAICIVVHALFMWCIWSRIAFSAAVLEAACQSFEAHPSMFFVSFGSIFVQVAWVVVWAFAVNKEFSQNQPSMGVQFFLVLSLYWTAQVVVNIVHVTCAGAVASWYYASGQGVTSAYCRAQTTSFGSICYASFVVAVIQAIKFVVNQAAAREGDNPALQFIRCCAMCILNCIEDLLKWFNLYALTFVAIYGDSYCEAAKACYTMMTTKGWAIIINDDLIGYVLMAGCLFGGAFNAGITYLMGPVFVKPTLNKDLKTDYDILINFTIIAAVIGYIMTMCAMVVIRSAVATFMVCFIQDPATLSQTRSEVYEPVAHGWKTRFGGKCPPEQYDNTQ